MAKSKNDSSYWSELRSLGLYKPKQGRLVRQLSGIAIVLVIFLGAWTLSQGPLSEFINSAFVVTVTYPGTELDQGLEERLRQGAAKEHGTLVDSQVDAGSHTLGFYFPTSRLWKTRSELREDRNEKAIAFRQKVNADYSPAKSLINVRHQVRQVGWIKFGVPLAISAVGAWLAFRLVNYSKFADFLISVEAEMDKVSWASKQELLRATIVVLVTMFFLGFVLLGFDLFWRWLFRLIGWLQF